MRERTIIALASLATAWTFAAVELATPGDAVAAFALDEHAHAPGTAVGVTLDAAEALATVRPWQPEYAEARRRLERIEAARVTALHPSGATPSR